MAVLLEQKIRSPLRYPGGKQKAIEQIAKFLPASSFEYREPLVGGGSVYFYVRAKRFAQHYWINDKFQELISFWHIVQNPKTCQKLILEMEQLHSQFTSADEIKSYYLRARQENPLDEYRQAFLFFFFNRVTFSGTTNAGGFSEAASLRRFTASSIARLKPLPVALEKTLITNESFENIISKPGEDVFIFLDPPYYTANKLYGHKGVLHRFEHERLADILKETKHKFLITYDDCPEIRELYQWANIRQWQLQYGMNNCNTNHTSKIGSELFISNY